MESAKGERRHIVLVDDDDDDEDDDYDEDFDEEMEEEALCDWVNNRLRIAGHLEVDNVAIAISHMDKRLGIKPFGFNPEDIVDGNKKQIIGLIFSLYEYQRKRESEAKASLRKRASTLLSRQLQHELQQYAKENPVEEESQEEPAKKAEVNPNKVKRGSNRMQRRRSLIALINVFQDPKSLSSPNISQKPVKRKQKEVNEENEKKRKEVEKQRAKEKEKRAAIAKEILETERTYVSCLRVMLDCYMTPLSKCAEINQDDIRKIFPILDVMCGFNTQLLSMLETRIGKWEEERGKIADIFISMSHYMKMYTNYINKYSDAIAALTNLRKKSSTVNQLIDNARYGENCKGLDINDYLIMPVQRLPRYVLLLSEMLKNTPSDHVDYEDLKVAVQQMQDIAEYVNEQKRNSDAVQAIVHVQSKLMGKAPELISPSRKFVKEGPLIQFTENGEKKRWGFLFNDCIVIGSPASSSFREGWKRYTAISNEYWTPSSGPCHFRTLILLSNKAILPGITNASKKKDKQQHVFHLLSPLVMDGGRPRSELASIISNTINSTAYNLSNGSSSSLLDKESSSSAVLSNAGSNNANSATNSSSNLVGTTSTSNSSTSIGGLSGIFTSNTLTTFSFAAPTAEEREDWIRLIDKSIAQTQATSVSRLLRKKVMENRKDAGTPNKSAGVLGSSPPSQSPLAQFALKDSPVVDRRKPQSEVAVESNNVSPGAASSGILSNGFDVTDTSNITETRMSPMKTRNDSISVNAGKLFQVLNKTGELLAPNANGDLERRYCTLSEGLFQWYGGDDLTNAENVIDITIQCLPPCSFVLTSSSGKTVTFTSVNPNASNAGSGGLVHSGSNANISAITNSGASSPSVPITSSNLNTVVDCYVWINYFRSIVEIELAKANELEIKVRDSKKKWPKELSQLLDFEENRQCAECGENDGSWISLELGVIVCNQCASVHRMLGPVSKIKCLTKGNWTPAQLEEMMKLGNHVKNREYEENVSLRKPTADCDAKERMRWVQEKYKKQILAYAEREKEREKENSLASKSEIEDVDHDSKHSEANSSSTNLLSGKSSKLWKGWLSEINTDEEGNASNVKRWWVIKKSVVSIFQSDKKSKAVTTIELNGCKVNSLGDQAGFELETPLKSYWLVAENGQERDKWIQAFENGIDYIPVGSSSGQLSRRNEKKSTRMRSPSLSGFLPKSKEKGRERKNSVSSGSSPSSANSSFSSLPINLIGSNNSSASSSPLRGSVDEMPPIDPGTPQT